MRSSLACGFAFAASCSAAIQLVARDEPAVVQFDIRRSEPSLPAATRDRLRKRAGTVSAPLLNEATLYLANASLGTPPQNFELHIDTGKPDHVRESM